MCQRTYDILKSELHDELLVFFDSYILFLMTNQQTPFAAEEVFRSETVNFCSLWMENFLSGKKCLLVCHEEKNARME